MLNIVGHNHFIIDYTRPVICTITSCTNPKPIKLTRSLEAARQPKSQNFIFVIKYRQNIGTIDRVVYKKKWFQCAEC